MDSDLGSELDFDAGDFERIQSALDGLNISANKFSRTLTRSFSTALVSGKSFEAVLKSIAQSFVSMSLSAGLRPLQNTVSSLIGSAFSSIGGGMQLSITPFANGGVVSRPTLFGSQGGLGLMGEQGAEAIVPLARGPDGKLGLAANGPGQKPVNVTINISTPDADSFRRSQVQIAGAMARVVARGSRST